MQILKGLLGSDTSDGSDTSGTDSTAGNAGSTDTGGGDVGFDGGGFDF